MGSLRPWDCLLLSMTCADSYNLAVCFTPAIFSCLSVGLRGWTLDLFNFGVLLGRHDRWREGQESQGGFNEAKAGQEGRRGRC